MIDLTSPPLNTEVEISQGRYSAFVINYAPAKKLYSWTLYYSKDNELHPVRPKSITGQVKNWDSEAMASADLQDQLQEEINE